ncbi:hypothetical protein GN956_G8170 [Arapaima gigas]
MDAYKIISFLPSSRNSEPDSSGKAPAEVKRGPACAVKRDFALPGSLERAMSFGPPKLEGLTNSCIRPILVIVLFSVLMVPLLRTVGLRAFSMASETYSSGTHSTAFVTCPNEQVAKDLARGMVEKKLAACVNIMPKIKSVYEWQGKIEEDSEVLMVTITASAWLCPLCFNYRSNHPYEVAEVISLPIDQGNLPYMKWLSEVVPE